MVLRTRWPGFVLLAPLALAGCEPSERPGELVGRYDVTGALTRNACGTAALPISDPLQFNVEIRDDQGTALWFMDSPQGVPGTIAITGAFHFQHEQQVQVRPAETEPEPEDPSDFLNPEPEQPVADNGCSMLITEVVSGTLHRDARRIEPTSMPRKKIPADLTGTNQIQVAVAPGSNCAESVSANGGPFLTLPCSAKYDITGMLLDD